MSKEQESPEEQVTGETEKLIEQTTGTEDSNSQVADAEEGQEVSVAELQQQLEQARRKAEENWNKAVRVQADMENLKRRTQKDLENAHKFALEKFARELLTVMDSLELGIQAANSDAPEVVKLREGSELTIKQFESVFAKFNIEVIDPIGQPFDPEHHQAMSMQPSPEFEPNTVMKVFQKGYLLNGRLIRPATVVVAKAAENVQKEDTGQA
jgi:molecular chaperone GrpE